MIYGIYDVNALQLRMLEGLARVLAARLFLPWSAAAEPFAFAQQTVDRLRIGAVSDSTRWTTARRRAGRGPAGRCSPALTARRR